MKPVVAMVMVLVEAGNRPTMYGRKDVIGQGSQAIFELLEAEMATDEWQWRR